MRPFQGDCDVDLATKVLTLILAAMDASDADTHADLRQVFLKKLLENGKLFYAHPVSRKVRYGSATSTLLQADSCMYPVSQLSSNGWLRMLAFVLTHLLL